MAISNKTRKILWTKAGNQCALCGKNLVITLNKNTVIGEECHIISSKKNGPRYRVMEDYDDYSNLILLCSEHHKLIDDNVEVFTELILLELKKAHELKVEKKLKIINNDAEIFLTKAENVRDLVRYLDGAEQYATDYPIECEEDYQLFSEFFELVHNSDLLDDINEIDKMSYFKDIYKLLEDSGYVILLGKEEKYGEYRLKTVFVVIQTLEEYEKNKITLN